MVTHDERFLEFVARKRAEEAAIVKVTWRKVSADTGGGWSGLGPKGALVFAREAPSKRWDGAKYEYGTIDGKVRVLCGGAKTLRSAKERAAALLGAKT